MIRTRSVRWSPSRWSHPGHRARRVRQQRVAARAASEHVDHDGRRRRQAPGGTLVVGAEQEPRLRRLDRQLRRVVAGAPEMMEYQTMPRVVRLREGRTASGPNVPSPMMASMPTVDRRSTASRPSPTPSARPRSGPTASRSPRATSSTRGTRSPRARTSTTRPATTRSRASTTTNPKTAVVTFKEPFASWTAAVRRGLRHPARRTSSRARTAHKLDEERLRLVRWSVDREVAQGRRASR